MKKLDRLLISSFIGPFIVTFMIAMFVLLMQILWLYIDDIAGKGLGFFILVELIAYKCVGLIPMALPLAILISSVMVLGSMAEHYELSSFKSAGVRLLRIMRPLIIFAFGCTIFSYICSNNLIPIANLKFGSRMYDIQRQKPALRLDAGIFNDDFENYAIHIGRKSGNGRTIHDVIMYDHSEASRGNLTEITAEDGEMFATNDGRYFIMRLRNGHQYIESSPTTGRGGGERFPFIRTTFASWTKIFDLSEFQLARTNEELFKQNRSMLSSGQLRVAIDSISLKILQRQKTLANQVAGYYTFMPLDSTFLMDQFEEQYGPMEDMPQSSPPNAADTLDTPPADTVTADVADTPAVDIVLQEQDPSEAPSPPAGGNKAAIAARKKAADRPGPVAASPLSVSVSDSIADAPSTERLLKQLPLPTQRPTIIRRDRVAEMMNRLDTMETATFPALIGTFNKRERTDFYAKSRSAARGIQSQAESAVRALDNLKEERVKHIYDLHTKYSMAVVCMIFIFIGAPMGAIVRKGGFGYPILVSIIFFMLFVILTIFCRKIAESFVLPAAAAGWLPCAILFPIGLVLTRKAMNDSKLLDLDRYAAFFRKLIKKRTNNS